MRVLDPDGREVHSTMLELQRRDPAAGEGLTWADRRAKMNGVTDEAMRTHFESAGLEHVRLVATTIGFTNHQSLALKWIAEKEREAREQQQAFQVIRQRSQTAPSARPASRRTLR